MPSSQPPSRCLCSPETLSPPLPPVQALAHLSGPPSKTPSHPPSPPPSPRCPWILEDKETWRFWGGGAWFASGRCRAPWHPFGTRSSTRSVLWDPSKGADIHLRITNRPLHASYRAPSLPQPRLISLNMFPIQVLGWLTLAMLNVTRMPAKSVDVCRDLTKRMNCQPKISQKRGHERGMRLVVEGG